MVNGECIEWERCRHDFGYGVIVINRKNVHTHRRAWELMRGPIPKGMVVCHRCDNPPCFNVNHLFLGSQKENMQDMWAKGRGVSPFMGITSEQNPSAKLNYSDVSDTRMALQLGVRQTELSRLFGVSRGVINKIFKGGSWVA